MLMQDRMHTIDLGVIITLIKAIMRKFFECVEIFLDKEGLAASKLETRFKNVLATSTGPDNQTGVYCIYCILCILSIYDIVHIIEYYEIFCIFCK